MANYFALLLFPPFAHSSESTKIAFTYYLVVRLFVCGVRSHFHHA